MLLFAPDVFLLTTDALKSATSYLMNATHPPSTQEGRASIVRALPNIGSVWVADRDVAAKAQPRAASGGAAQALVALKLRKAFGFARQSILEQFILWFQVPREEAKHTRAFQDGVAAFKFGSKTKQVSPGKKLNVYDIPPYALKPKVPAIIADAVRRCLTGYHSGNKGAEMMERSLEALCFTGYADGLDNVLVCRGQGRKGTNCAQHPSEVDIRAAVEPTQFQHTLHGGRGTQTVGGTHVFPDVRF